MILFLLTLRHDCLWVVGCGGRRRCGVHGRWLCLRRRGIDESVVRRLFFRRVEIAPAPVLKLGSSWNGKRERTEKMLEFSWQKFYPGLAVLFRTYARSLARVQVLTGRHRYLTQLTTTIYIRMCTSMPCYASSKVRHLKFQTETALECDLLQQYLLLLGTVSLPRN